MDAFNNFLTGTVTLFSDPLGILIFFGGVIGGMLFGAIPGVSMLTLAAILLPFTAHRPAQIGGNFAAKHTLALPPLWLHNGALQH